MLSVVGFVVEVPCVLIVPPWEVEKRAESEWVTSVDVPDVPRRADTAATLLSQLSDPNVLKHQALAFSGRDLAFSLSVPAEPT